jgi:hypothetical protein
MRSHPASAATLLLALVVAGAALVPCACAEMSAAETSGGHCGPDESGLRAGPEACICPCITASDEASAALRVQLVPVRKWSVVTASHAPVPGSYPLPPEVPPRRLGHPPPLTPPSILRI